MCCSWSHPHTKAPPPRQVSILGKPRPRHKNGPPTPNSKQSSLTQRSIHGGAAPAHHVRRRHPRRSRPPSSSGTVGGKDGWFFDAKTNTSSGNYSDWANGETFYVGDNLSMLPLLLRAGRLVGLTCTVSIISSNLTPDPYQYSPIP
jgi:hypothetical protein